jgi:transcriptional regulator with XRE-family HTH domain
MKKSKINSGQKSISKDQLKELQLIGQVIRELRFSYGLMTQKELAEKCGIHFNTIKAIECGDKNYNILSFMKIISFFNFEISIFFKEFG